MHDSTLHFDAESYASVDQLALLARQDYNLGGTGDWFGAFRGGLYGFYARLYGVQRHYSEVHAWLPRLRIIEETEYHLASILFQMDSALECLTFALNALGWVAMESGFRDVTDSRALRRIGPLDILGDRKRSPLSGYTTIFPTLQVLWQRQKLLIDQIRDLHDVSKHRETIYVGGRRRLDTPVGFYESLGIPEGDASRRTLLCPEAEIILKCDPKAPSGERSAQPGGQRDLLEDLVPTFASFINDSGAAALADGQANIHLNETRFRSEMTHQVRKLVNDLP